MKWYVQLELTESEVQFWKAEAKERNTSTACLIGTTLSEVLRRNLLGELLRGVQLRPRYARDPEPAKGRTPKEILSGTTSPPAPSGALPEPERPPAPPPASPTPSAAFQGPPAPSAAPAPPAASEGPPPAPVSGSLLTRFSRKRPERPSLRVVKSSSASAPASSSSDVEKRRGDFRALEKAIRYPGDFLDSEVAALREQWQWGDFSSEESKILARAERARAETYSMWRSSVVELQAQLKKLEQAIFRSSGKQHVVQRGKLKRQRTQVSRQLANFKREIRYDERNLGSTG